MSNSVETSSNNNNGSENEKPKSRFSLSKAWAGVAKRIPTKNTLRKAFTPAALGIAAGVGAKIAALAAGAAVLGPVFTVAAGVGLTSYSFVKGYKAQEESKNPLDYFKKNWKTYSFKFALNSTSAFIGFGGADWLIDTLSGGTEGVEACAAAATNTQNATTAVEGTSDIDCNAEEQDNDVVEVGDADTDIDAEQNNDELGDANADAETEDDIIEDPEIIIPEDAYEKLEMLAQQEGLTEQAQEMIDAALKGQTWAVRDIGLGLINGFYGFDQLGEMAGHVDADAWGAALLKDAVETGDVKARIDYAYFQYTGVNEAIVQNQAAALETVEELDRVWLHGDSVLEQVHIDQAKEQFIANMPEGTNIEDYRVEKMGEDGYKFINIAEEAKILAEQKAALSEAGYDANSCNIAQNAAHDGYVVSGCKPVF